MQVKQQTKYLFAIFLFILFTAVWSSCQKDTQCNANVTIVDTAARPRSGVSVQLGYNGTTPGRTTISVTQITDITGTTQFSFKLPAVYDVNLTYGGRTDSAVGNVRLAVGSTVNYTFTWR